MTGWGDAADDSEAVLRRSRTHTRPRAHHSDEAIHLFLAACGGRRRHQGGLNGAITCRHQLLTAVSFLDCGCEGGEWLS